MMPLTDRVFHRPPGRRAWKISRCHATVGGTYAGLKIGGAPGREWAPRLCIEHVDTGTTNELDALEVKLTPAIAAQELQRMEAINQARNNLGIYDEMTKSLRAELEKRRQLELIACL